MAYESNDRKNDSVYSQRVRAGKRRTYFFDVRETRGSDFYLTITESRKKFNEDGYDRHKIFLYKEDFNKFLKGITEAIDFVKTELMPDFDFDVFSHEQEEPTQGGQAHGDSSRRADSDAPTGIAAAATPELESSDDDTPTGSGDTDTDSQADSGSSSDRDVSSGDDTSHRDEHVDKW